MASKEYSELLKDPRWQKRKAEIMMRDNYACQCCGCTNKTLHVHHKYYDGRKPWEYEDDALITLCEDCHSKEHDKAIPKVGSFYNFDHSDYWNDMVCYHVDNRNRLAYLFGVDCGAYGTPYIYVFRFDDFKNGKIKYSKAFEPDENGEYDNYTLDSFAIAYRYLSESKSDVYGVRNYPDESIISFAKDSVRNIVKNNQILSEWIDNWGF